MVSKTFVQRLAVELATLSLDLVEEDLISALLHWGAAAAIHDPCAMTLLSKEMTLRSSIALSTTT